METKRFFPRRELKEEGRASLSGHWGKAIVIILIGALISGIPSIVNFNTQMGSIDFENMNTAMYASQVQPDAGTALLGILLTLLSAVLIAAYTMATSKWYLDLVQKNPNISLGDFFGNFSLAGKGILAWLWMSLWMFIWMLIPVAIFIAAMMLGGAAMFASDGSSGGTFVSFLLMLAAFAVYIGIAIWKGYSYGQIFNVIADSPNIGVRDAMRYSIAMTKDYIMDLFILDLSFILWGLLIIVTLGLASFYVGPYMASAQAMAYFFLRDQALDRGLLSPQEFGLEKQRVREEPIVEEPYMDETIEKE